MASTGAVDIFMVYQFLKRLAMPFTRWDAYKQGVIDKDGKILIPKNKRDFKQNQSLKVFDVMILKLKSGVVHAEFIQTCRQRQTWTDLDRLCCATLS